MKGEWFKKHGPEIAIIGGMVTITAAGVGACFATAAAIKEVDRIEREKGVTLTRKERFKVMLPYYIGPIAGLIVGGSFAAGGIHGGWVRTKNIAQAARMAEETLQAQKEAAIEVVGEKKATEIEKTGNKTLNDGAIKRFLMSGLPILGKGETYFVDKELLGDRVFLGDIQTIRSRYNDIRERMNNGELVMNNYEIVEYVYPELEIKSPECFKMLEYEVGFNGTPQIDIDTAVEPDEEGRIIHYIRHINHARLTRLY